MSHDQDSNFNREEAEGVEPEEQFVDLNEVAEVVADDNGPVNDSDEDMDDMETLEIDLSNNSFAYFDQHTDSVYLIASHPTLPLVVSGGGDNLGYLWTTHSSSPKVASKLTGHEESVIAGGFSADGNFLVTGDMAGQLRVWKSKSKGEKWEFYTSVNEVEEVVWIRFHPKLPIIAVGAQDGTVWVYELGPKFTNLAVLSAHSLPTTNGLFVETADETQLSLITISEDSQIILWNVYQSQARYSLGPTKLRGEHPWVSIEASPTGNSVAVGAMDGVLVIIKVADGALLQYIDTNPDESVEQDARSIEGLAWSDKTNLLAVGNVDGTVSLYSVANWKVRSTLKHEDSITKLIFAPGTSHLYASAMDGSLVVWDVLSGQKLWEGKGHNAGVLGFAAQNDFKRLITAGDEGVSLVFNVE